MKKILLLIAFTAILGQHIQAQEFNAVAPSGQTLHYEFCDGIDNGMSFGPEQHHPSGVVVSAKTLFDTITIIDNCEDCPTRRYYLDTTISGYLIIPDSVSFEGINYSVVGIDQHGFNNCRRLIAVYLPNSITYIGHIDDPDSYWDTIGPFFGCNGLRTVNLPNSITEIGTGSFSGCSGLTSIIIPNSVTSIHDHAFSGCSGLSSVNLPNSINGIGWEAFSRCTGLSSITIPSSVEYIGTAAFSGCSNLHTINFYAECEYDFDPFNYYYPYNFFYSRSRGAFQGCPASVNIGDNVSYIPDGLFDSCSDITSVTLGNSVNTIGIYAFSGCSGLSSITFPNSVRSIRGYAFAGCSGLSSITINEINLGIAAFSNCNLDTVIINGAGYDPWSYYDRGTYMNWPLGYAGAFENSHVSIAIIRNDISEKLFLNSGVTTIIIDSAVTSIGLDAFGSCNVLNTVYYYAQRCSPTWDLEFDEGYISPFRGCSNISTIYFGEDVVSIPISMFNGCSGIDSIISYNSTAPLLGSNTFRNVSNTIPVMIPCGSLSSYDSLWSCFSNFHEMRPFIFSVLSADTSKGVVTILNTPSCTDSTALFFASPTDGYRFDHWSDICTDNPRTMTLHSDTVILAYFIANAPTVYIRDTVFVHDTTYITREVHDTTFINRYVHDTTYINNYVHDTLIAYVNQYVHDTTFITNYIHDTSYIYRTQYDTLFVYNTVHDTAWLTAYIHDTTFVNNYIHDTVWLTQTVWEYIHDTVIEHVHHYIHDTTFINNYIHDTTYLTQYVDRYIHDTVMQYVNQYIHDTTFINNYIHDTVINYVNNYIHDTTFINNYIYDTIYLYRYIHDTIYVHDTIYIQEGEGIDNIALLNAKIYQRNGQIVVEGAEGYPVYLYDVVGRLLATRRETMQEVLLDVPASGAYLVKIGDAPARRIVVRR